MNLKTTLLYLTLVCFIYGCDGMYPKKEKDVERYYPDYTLGIDTVTYPFPTFDSNRYFLISYSTQTAIAYHDIAGHFAIASKTFIPKKDIDSIVFDILPLKRKCYQEIVITSLFEFKNKAIIKKIIRNKSNDCRIRRIRG